MLERRRTFPKGFDYGRWLVERERCQLGNHLPEPPFKEAEKMCSAIDSALKKIGISFSASEDRIQSDWMQIVGKDIAKHAMPGALNGSTLSVFVMGSAWLAELKRNGVPNMIKRINETCGENTVKRINLIPAPSGYKR